MDLQYKTPKGIEALSNNNIINRDKKDTGVQLELTTRQRALFLNITTWIKIIDDPPKIIREHFIDLPKQ